MDDQIPFFIRKLGDRRWFIISRIIDQNMDGIEPLLLYAFAVVILHDLLPSYGQSEVNKISK